MQLTRCLAICKVRLLWRGEDSNDLRFPVLHQDRSINPLVSTDSFWKISTFTCTVLFLVAAVLAWCCQSQIKPLVLSRIAVDVVHIHSSGNFHTLKGEDDTMGIPSSFNASIGQRYNRGVGSSLLLVPPERKSGGFPNGVSIVSSKASLVLEVFSWPFLPNEIPGFWIVNKALAQERDGWQFSDSLHDRSFRLCGLGKVVAEHGHSSRQV